MQMQIAIVFHLVVHLSLTADTVKADCVQYGSLSTLKRLEEKVYSKFVTSSAKQCFDSCKADPLCLGQGIYTLQGQGQIPSYECRLVTLVGTVAKATSAVSLALTSTTSGSQQSVQLDVSPCVSNPCLHDATCVDRHGYYVCNCQHGYTGQYCTTIIDNCLSAPCVNGGTCINGVNSLTCSCTSGFTGVYCQAQVSSCSTSSWSCSSTASCPGSPSQYPTCICGNSMMRGAIVYTSSTCILTSPNLNYCLKLTADGTLAIVSLLSLLNAWIQPTSSTASFVAFQTDGNLVIYSKSGQALWYTMTVPGACSTYNVPLLFTLTNSGQLAAINCAGSTVWITNAPLLGLLAPASSGYVNSCA